MGFFNTQLRVRCTTMGPVSAAVSAPVAAGTRHAVACRAFSAHLRSSRRHTDAARGQYGSIGARSCVHGLTATSSCGSSRRLAAVAHAQRRRRLFKDTSSSDEGEGDAAEQLPPKPPRKVTPPASSSSGLADLPVSGIQGISVLRPLFQAEQRKALLSDAQDIRQGADLDRISRQVAEAGLGNLQEDWAEVEALKQRRVTSAGAAGSSTLAGPGGLVRPVPPGGMKQLMRPQPMPGGPGSTPHWLSPEASRRLARQERRRVPTVQRPQYLAPLPDDQDDTDDDWTEEFEFLDEADLDSWGNDSATQPAQPRSTIPAMTPEQRRQMALQQVQERSARLQAMRAQQREKQRRAEEQAAAAAEAPAAGQRLQEEQQQPHHQQQQQQQQQKPPAAGNPLVDRWFTDKQGAAAASSPRPLPAQPTPSSTAQRAPAPATSPRAAPAPGPAAGQGAPAPAAGPSMPVDFQEYIAMRQREKAAAKAAAMQAQKEAAAQRLLQRQATALAASKAPTGDASKAAKDKAGKGEAAVKAVNAFEQLLADPKTQAAIARLSNAAGRMQLPTIQAPGQQHQAAGAAKPVIQQKPLTPAQLAELERQQQLQEQQQMEEWQAQLDYVKWAADMGKASDAQQRLMAAAGQTLPALSQQQLAAADRAAKALQQVMQPKAARPVARPGSTQVSTAAASPPSVGSAAKQQVPKSCNQQQANMSEPLSAAPAVSAEEAEGYAAWAAEAAAAAAEEAAAAAEAERAAAETQAAAAAAAAAALQEGAKKVSAQEARLRSRSMALTGLKRPPSLPAGAGGSGSLLQQPAPQQQVAFERTQQQQKQQQQQPKHRNQQQQGKQRNQQQRKQANGRQWQETPQAAAEGPADTEQQEQQRPTAGRKHQRNQQPRKQASSRQGHQTPQAASEGQQGRPAEAEEQEQQRPTEGKQAAGRKQQQQQQQQQQQRAQEVVAEGQQGGGARVRGVVVAAANFSSGSSADEQQQGKQRNQQQRKQASGRQGQQNPQAA